MGNQTCFHVKLKTTHQPDNFASIHKKLKPKPSQPHQKCTKIINCRPSNKIPSFKPNTVITKLQISLSKLQTAITALNQALVTTITLFFILKITLKTPNRTDLTRFPNKPTLITTSKTQKNKQSFLAAYTKKNHSIKTKKKRQRETSLGLGFQRVKAILHT